MKAMSDIDPMHDDTPRKPSFKIKPGDMIIEEGSGEPLYFLVLANPNFIGNSWGETECSVEVFVLHTSAIGTFYYVDGTAINMKLVPG